MVKTGNIFVSVIIPVYNAEPYLEQCLQSVMKQTLRNIEIICIDDGSEDGSVQIIQRLQREDRRILLLRQENKGAGAARNAGMARAGGEFVAFIDADDWYPEAGVLELLYRKAKKNDVFICGGSFCSFKNGQIVTEYSEINRPYVFAEEGLIRYEDYQFEFGYQRFIFNRAFLRKKGLIFPDYRRFQDPPFFVRAMIEASCFYAVPDIVYTYRENYKKIAWTPQKAMDLLSGVTDLLSISDRCNLDDLHYRTYRRLCGYTDILLNAVREAPSLCIERLCRANRALNASILKKYDRCIDENNVFPALDIFLHCPVQEIAGPQPKVSVIIPIYNVEEFIVECVGSVVGQTLKEIEIICVNDGSPDNSIPLLEKNFGQDPRIKIVNKKNGGLSSARNAGARVATGEYLYFLDSDDYIDRSALEILYGEAKKDSLDLLVFDADSFSDERFTTEERREFMSQKVQNYLNYYRRKGEYSEVVKGQVLFMRMKAKGEHRSAVWLQLIRREFYVRNKIDSYPGIIHEDNLFTLKTFLLAERAKHIPACLYHRRVRLGSIMTEREGVRNLNGYFVTYSEALRFLVQKGNAFYPKARDAYVSEMANYVRAIRRIAAGLPQEEREKYYSSLNHGEKILYDFILSTNGIEGMIEQLCVTTADVENKINEIVAAYGGKDKNGIARQDAGAAGGAKPEKSAPKRKHWFRQKVRGFFRCLREHGFTYTMIRLFGGRERALRYEASKKK